PRCNFWNNHSMRTFIDIRTEKPAEQHNVVPIAKVTKVPLMQGEQRLIIATFVFFKQKTAYEMKEIKKGLDQLKDKHPNFVDMASKEVFRSTNPKSVADPLPTRAWTKAAKDRIALMQNRKNVRNGIPRVLNTNTYAPLIHRYAAR